MSMLGSLRPPAGHGTSRDLRGETGGCFLVIIAAVAFVVSTFLTWRELQFLLWGRTADGVLEAAQEVRQRRNRGWRVAYRFHDHRGQEVARRAFLPLSWVPPQDKKLVVEYLTSEPPETRLAGTGSRWGPLFFGGTLIFLAVTLLRFYLEARRAVAMRAPPSWSPQQ